MFRRLSLYAGIALMLIAVAGLVFWESAGRDRVMMAETVAAAGDIRAGAVIKPEMLRVLLVPKGSQVEGGFLAGQEGEIIGRKTAEAIYGRQQISAKSFHATDDGMKEGEAYFVIPGEWIAMRSSALRRGDSVEVLSVSGGAINLGTYRIAFVKDADEREVWDIGPAGEILYEPEAMPDRTDALAAIDHVEIIATKAEYYAIRDFAAGAGAPSLVLVQKEAEL